MPIKLLIKNAMKKNQILKILSGCITLYQIIDPQDLILLINKGTQLFKSRYLLLIVPSYHEILQKK